MKGEICFVEQSREQFSGTTAYFLNSQMSTWGRVRIIKVLKIAK